LGPLLLIGEDLVGAGDILELGLGRLVARIAVRMELPRELAIRLLDLVLGRASRNAE
jgi:hypothetical protein